MRPRGCIQRFCTACHCMSRWLPWVTSKLANGLVHIVCLHGLPSYAVVAAMGCQQACQRFAVAIAVACRGSWLGLSWLAVEVAMECLGGCQQSGRGSPRIAMACRGACREACHGLTWLAMACRGAAFMAHRESCNGTCHGTAVGCHGECHGTCHGHNHCTCRGSAMDDGNPWGLLRQPTCHGHNHCTCRGSAMDDGNPWGLLRQPTACHGSPWKAPRQCRGYSRLTMITATACH